MSVTLPELRVGQPLCHEAVSVFPLYSDSNGDVEYRLSDEALADESIVVEEVSERGSVPNLLVENKNDVRVLFLEGEELVGAKQNRVLNTSLLVAAHTKIKIPVSCVEQGRWRFKSRHFGSSGSHSPFKLRHALKASVTRSVKEKRGHESDQGAVWDEVASLNKARKVDSKTTAMSDAFETYKARIAAAQERMKYAEGATGLAVAIGDKVVALDVFDKPTVCEKIWSRLLSGVVLDAMDSGEPERRPSVADVEQLLGAARKLPWEQVEAIGEGNEYRAESDQGDQASALAFEDTVVHGSIVTSA